MRKHLLAIALIITGAPGCDNVGWGGIDLEVAPPTEAEGPVAVEAEAEVQSTPDRVLGPVLIAGTREGERGNFVVVGEVQADALRTFPDPAFPGDRERLAAVVAPGAEWIVFSEGVRVGRLTVEQADPAQGCCGDRTALSCILEMVPSAATAERLVALPEAHASGRPREPYREFAHVYDQRVATLSVAGDAIRRYGARWPTLGVLDARDHIQAFQLRNAPGQSVAATFVVNDQLAVTPPSPGAYALFVMGQERDGTYSEAYTWYRNAEDEGKGVPRYFDHLDWNNDGTDEILLDVLGEDRRWFASLSLRNGTWVRTFQDACGAPAA
jgi:hypothetical protein